MLTAKVKSGELVVTVTEDGSLESAVNIDIKCEVAGGTSILWIVDDGTQVKKGEKIVELDSAALEESINQQRIATEKARAAKIQADKDHAAADLAVKEYLNGTFVQAQQDQDAKVTIAEENLRSAQNALEHSERMFRKGYISALDLESQKFQVQRRSWNSIPPAPPRTVLVNFTKLKMMQELESKRDSAEAKKRSEVRLVRPGGIATEAAGIAAGQVRDPGSGRRHGRLRERAGGAFRRFDSSRRLKKVPRSANARPCSACPTWLRCR